MIILLIHNGQKFRIKYKIMKNRNTQQNWNNYQENYSNEINKNDYTEVEDYENEPPLLEGN